MKFISVKTQMQERRLLEFCISVCVCVCVCVRVCVFVCCIVPVSMSSFS